MSVYKKVQNLNVLTLGPSPGFQKTYGFLKWTEGSQQ